MTQALGVRKVFIDGKEVLYTAEAQFSIEIGTGSKGKYQPFLFIDGNIFPAIYYFTQLVLKKGDKKRLVMTNAAGKNQVLTKVAA